MAQKEYTVNVNGVDHDFVLSDEDAELFRKNKKTSRLQEKKKGAPANKSRGAETKGGNAPETK